MSNRTLRRLERVLTMVPWLLDHPGAALDVIAHRFGATPGDVLADLDVLGYCGLPGYGGGDLIEVRLLGDRVSVHMADYFRRPLRLTVREAVTLLLAAQALAGVAALPESGPLARAAGRLERLLGADTGRGAAVTVELAEPADEHLATLRRAVDTGEVVRLTYRSESKAETTEREVEPWSLTAAGGAWYLQGWCRLADGPRDFRVDRIRAAAATGEAAPPPAADPDPPVYRPAPGDPVVVLDVGPGGAWVADWIVVDEVSEHGDRRRVRFRAANLYWAARLVLRLSGHAAVVSPPELAVAVADLAAATLARYDADAPDAP